MSLLNDDAGVLNVPPREDGPVGWILLKHFDDGALAIVDRETGQAMHLGPGKALQLRDQVAALDALTRDTTSKPTNPKDAVGSDKLPLHLWPVTATALGSVAMLNGLCKYGRSNFRAVGVRSSIYYDAARRHLDAWFEGEECDPDDGVPHLAAALACIAIIVDAGAAGKLTDDRMYPGGYRAFIDQLTPHVARLKALHAGRDPQHYTIATDE
jgi:hypothetical protein